MSPPRIQVDVGRFVRLTDLSTETACTLLGSGRTRVALYALSRCEPRLSLDQLAASVASVSEASRSSARISLVHATLPKLEEYGVLEYELRAETLELDGPVVGLDAPLGTRSRRGGGESESVPDSTS